MKDVHAFLRDAAQAEACGHGAEALDSIARALRVAGRSAERFDVLLWQARAEAQLLGNLEGALRTYWEARHAAQDNAVPTQVAEADLGIGMVLVEMGHAREGVEALRRAARAFRRAGQTFLRGCAEIVLADECLREGDCEGADRGLEVATDLLMAAGEPRIGDVVVVERPSAGPVLRRVVGLPGQRVGVEQGLAAQDGVVAIADRLRGQRGSRLSVAETRVDPGELLVLSDERRADEAASWRIRRRDVVGRATYVLVPSTLFPPDRMGLEVR